MVDRTNSRAAYLARLDRRIRDIASVPTATIKNVIRGGRGAFPTLVYERLRQQGLHETLPDGDVNHEVVTETVNHPELHPLDFEWYFTTDTATALADTLETEEEPVLCLGTPTVAYCLAQRDVKVTLVDRNRLLRERFSDDLDSLTFVRQDVTDRFELEETYPVAFFDPPWYPEHVHTWLARACQHLATSGQVYFVLFPPLTRPGAVDERNEIRDLVHKIGDLSIDREAVTYRTPGFEQAVLRDSDTPVVQDWRRADLVRVAVTNPDSIPGPPEMEREDKWDTFVTNGQVVKLRREPVSDPSSPITPLEGCEEYILPSVSRRDARRQNVDLWTSRNRVAAVGDRKVVVEALHLLAGGKELSDLTSTDFRMDVDSQQIETLLDGLAAVLQYPG